MTPRYHNGRTDEQQARIELEDMRYAMREIEAQKDELFEKATEIEKEMETYHDDIEYWEGRLTEIHEAVDELDSQEIQLRIKIDEIKTKYNLK